MGEQIGSGVKPEITPKNWREEFPNWKKEMSMFEVIHRDNCAKFKEAGIQEPDWETIQELWKNREDEKYIKGENRELDYNGIVITFPVSWQNEWAMLDKIYETIFESQNKP